MPSVWSLTSVPYNLDDVSLGSFIPDVHNPHQDVLRAIELLSSSSSVSGVEGGDELSRLLAVSVRDEQNVRCDLKTSDSSWFDAQLSRLVEGSHERSHDRALAVEAVEGRIYELREPRALFRRLCALPEVREWILQDWTQGLSTYMVVGYRTFRDAKSVAHSEDARKTGGRVEVPVAEALTGVPGADQLLGLNVGVGAGGAKGGTASLGATYPGERIYAICFRKVKTKWTPWKKGNPELKNTNQWVVNFPEILRTLGEYHDPEVVEADLDDEPPFDTEEVIHSAATTDGTDVFVIQR